MDGSGRFANVFVIGVPVVATTEERGSVELGHWQTFSQTARGIRIGYEWATERNHIRIAALEDPIGLGAIVMAGNDDRTTEPRTDFLAELLGELWRIIPVCLDEVEIGDALGLKEVCRL